MFPLFGLLTGVLCLIPRAETTNPYDHVLDGCTDLNDIAFKDWGHRAFLFAIIVKTAGYGTDLLYYCEREKEIALWSKMDGSEGKIAAGTLLLDHTAKNWREYVPERDDYAFLLEAGKDIGEQLKNVSNGLVQRENTVITAQGKKKTIGCKYDTNKKREVLCFAF